MFHCVSYIMSCMPSRCLYGHACFCVFSTSLFVVWCLCPERFLLCYILARVSFVVSYRNAKKKTPNKTKKQPSVSPSPHLPTVIHVYWYWTPFRRAFIGTLVDKACYNDPNKANFQLNRIGWNRKSKEYENFVYKPRHTLYILQQYTKKKSS